MEKCLDQVLICGPWPEPVGGVSVHVERLARFWNAQGVTVSCCDESATTKDDLFNIRTLNVKRYLGLVGSADIVHIHSSVGLFRLTHLGAAYLFRKKAIVTVHSWRGGRLSTAAWRWVLDRLCAAVVFVSNELCEKMALSVCKHYVFPAFIPPENSREKLPEDVMRFIKNVKSQNRKLAVSNAFRLIEFSGEDLYGLDLCLGAFGDSGLRHAVALVFVVSDPSVNRTKIEQYRRRVAESKLEESVLIHLGSLDYFSLLRYADLSIRATNTDGDALSVREAIFLGKPCVASDAVDRPAAAVIFESRSADSLRDKIRQVCDEEGGNCVVEVDNCRKEIAEFYRNLYGIQRER